MAKTIRIEFENEELIIPIQQICCLKTTKESFYVNYYIELVNGKIIKVQLSTFRAILDELDCL